MKKNKGITLIALVITIIVMLILVAVTISMAVNGGLFNYAKKAAQETDNAITKEQQLANLDPDLTVDELIEKYTGNSTTEKLPEDFFVYTDSTETVLTGINRKYLQEETIVGAHFDESIKLASTKPILIAGNDEKTETKNLKIVVDGNIKTKISVPEGVVEIAEGSQPTSLENAPTNAFSGVLIEEITLPTTLTTIGKRAFGNCETLKEISIPKSVTNMGIEIFNNCSETLKIMVPFYSSAEYPAGWLSDWNYNSTDGYWYLVTYASMEIDNNATVPDDFFVYTDSSKTVLTGINSNYLQEEFTVGANLKESIKLASTKPILLADDVKTEKYFKIVVNGKLKTKISIPEGVVEIGSASQMATLENASNNAFCNVLVEEVTLPTTLTTIGNQAFRGCKILNKINIPNSLMTVGGYVFSGCPATLEIVVPFTEEEGIPEGWSEDWARNNIGNDFDYNVKYAD